MSGLKGPTASNTRLQVNRLAVAAKLFTSTNSRWGKPHTRSHSSADVSRSSSRGKIVTSPPTTSAPPSALRRSTPARSHPSTGMQSASVKASTSPFAARIPRFLAANDPRFGSWQRVTWGQSAVTASAVSVDPLSTTTTS